MTARVLPANENSSHRERLETLAEIQDNPSALSRLIAEYGSYWSDLGLEDVSTLTSEGINIDSLLEACRSAPAEPPAIAETSPLFYLNRELGTRLPWIFVRDWTVFERPEVDDLFGKMITALKLTGQEIGMLSSRQTSGDTSWVAVPSTELSELTLASHCKFMVFFGQESAKHVLGITSSLGESGKLPHSNSLYLVTHDIVDLLQDPALKKSVWKHLQELQAKSQNEVQS